MIKKNVVLLSPCNYSRVGLEGLIRETHLSDSFELIASSDNLNEAEILLNTLPIVDLVILILNFENYSPVTLLSLLGKCLPDMHPNSNVIIMGNISHTVILNRYFNRLRNTWASLDSKISLEKFQALLLDIKHSNDNQFSNTEEPPKNLSSRELIVLRKLLDGSSIHNISDDLKISYKTVSHHKRAALIKLGVRSLCPLVNVNVISNR